MVKKDKENNSYKNLYPPVVAVLGHVDHGKTTLLDKIRKTNIADREHGGITQKIGASTIHIDHEGVKRAITFIDTPGHEAFGKMRGRGVQAADIGLLIVAATDGIKPQTKESIELLKAANTPFIVVITKIDLPNAIAEKAKQHLIKEGVELEGYGGNVPIIEVSSKTGDNIKELLDLILLVYDFKEHSEGSPKNPLKAVVIESRLDSKAGPKASVVIKDGTIRQRDELVSGKVEAKVRNLVNDRGVNVKEATIGDAIEILGFKDVPSVGSIVEHKNFSQVKVEVKEVKKQEEPSFEAMFSEEEKPIIPPFILVADSQGSLEAIVNSFSEDVKVILQKSGEIEPSDVMFAKSIGAVILGFNVRLKPEIEKLASVEKVFVRSYTIIYEMLDEVSELLEGKRIAMQEQILGTAKILARFPFEKTEVLGVSILDGRLAKGDRVRIIRGDDVIGETKISSLRHGKDQISKMEKGSEAGVLISPFLDFTIGDVLISHN
ncbi:GTP-binding protein [Patescibacteria group bacterium]|nr:GTP-binding protein [Patescibacteria group bacterium]